jgi:hypothetical protein
MRALIASPETVISLAMLGGPFAPEAALPASAAGAGVGWATTDLVVAAGLPTRRGVDGFL